MPANRENEANTLASRPRRCRAIGSRMVRMLCLGALIAVIGCGGRSEREDQRDASAPPVIDASVPGMVASSSADAGSDAGAGGAGDGDAGSAGHGGAGDAGSAGGTGDDDPGAGLPPAQAAYARFQAQAAKIRQDRARECFNATGPDLAPENDGEAALNNLVYGPSLSVGSESFDEAQASKCLDTMLHASCSDLAVAALFVTGGKSEGPRSVCDGALRGNVVPGGACLRNEDCENPDQFACTRDLTDSSGCSSRCRPRPELGESCSGNCASGNHCSSADAECVSPFEVDAHCTSTDECGAGLYCRYETAGVVEGACRPIAVGAACAWSWECPLPYVCNSGKCQVGRANGQPCTVESEEPFFAKVDDCALSLTCYSNSAGVLVCAPGRGLSEVCTGTIPCQVGYCDNVASPQVRRCLPFKRAGQACAGTNSCATGLECRESVCQHPGPTVGEPCSTSDCVGEAYCDFLDQPIDPVTPGSEINTCQPRRTVGQACSVGEPCELLSSCNAGVCQHCASAP